MARFGHRWHFTPGSVWLQIFLATGISLAERIKARYILCPSGCLYIVGRCTPCANSINSSTISARMLLICACLGSCSPGITPKINIFSCLNYTSCGRLHNTPYITLVLCVVYWKDWNQSTLMARLIWLSRVCCAKNNWDCWINWECLPNSTFIYVRK